MSDEIFKVVQRKQLQFAKRHGTLPFLMNFDNPGQRGLHGFPLATVTEFRPGTVFKPARGNPLCWEPLNHTPLEVAGHSVADKQVPIDMEPHDRIYEMAVTDWAATGFPGQIGLYFLVGQYGRSHGVDMMDVDVPSKVLQEYADMGPAAVRIMIHNILNLAVDRYPYIAEPVTIIDEAESGSDISGPDGASFGIADAIAEL